MYSDWWFSMVSCQTGVATRVLCAAGHETGAQSALEAAHELAWVGILDHREQYVMLENPNVDAGNKTPAELAASKACYLKRLRLVESERQQRIAQRKKTRRTDWIAHGLALALLLSCVLAF
jgi:hypothetical protein